MVPQPPLPALSWPAHSPGAYGPRFADALAVAAWGHRDQWRKRGVDEDPGTATPYVGHVLEVAALALAAGADEEQAIAALLHDGVEDWADAGSVPTPGAARELIAERFGDRVLALVLACTDDDPAGSGRRDASTWRARKEHHLERLRGLPDDHLLVPAADKVANIRALLDDVADAGVTVWARFNAPPPDLLWYYRGNLAVFRDRQPQALLTRRLSALVVRLADAVPSG